MTEIKVVDVETTSLHDPLPVEIGAVELTLTNKNKVKIGKHYSDIVNPNTPIDFAAMAIHCITNLMVKGKPLLKDVISKYDSDIYVAHNAPFDNKSLYGSGLKDGKWICTLKLARHFYPEYPKHTNLYLFYRWGLDEQVVFPEGTYPHSTTFDTLATSYVLKYLVEKHNLSLEDLLNLGGIEGYTPPPEVKFEDMVCKFPKYKDMEMKWIDVCKSDSSYVEWLLGSGKISDDKLIDGLVGELEKLNGT